MKIGIVMGLRAREPAIDILDVKTAGLRGMADPTLLEIAAQQDRVLITYDSNTMPRHFRGRLDLGKPTPGVFILPEAGERHRRDRRIAATCVGGIASRKSGGIRSHICRSGELAIANPNLMALTGGKSGHRTSRESAPRP